MTSLGILPGGRYRPDLRPGGRDRPDLRPGGLGAVAPSAKPPAPYMWPVPGGYATSPYGYRTHPKTGLRTFHGGLDIGKGSGASIVAPAAGRVTYRNDDVNNDAGRYIIVEHDDGWRTSYLHLLTSPVSVGARVQRGQVIGLMGTTGSSTAPHLHWIVRTPDGTTVDPLVVLRGSYPKKSGGSVRGQYGGLDAGKLILGVALVGGGYWFFKKRRR